MAVDQVQPATLEHHPSTTTVQPIETLPPPPPADSLKSVYQQSLLDLVSREEDEFLSREDHRKISQFLMAMLWGSLAVALVVAVYVLIANGHWITRYLPR
ncbi:MAG: hypothetical protein WC859_04515 [Elusimicrobiota bacterium]|jgi:hypothetical protein